MRSLSGAEFDPELEGRLIELLLRDEYRMRVMRMVRQLELPDCWIGAGFVRNAVWDELHGRERPTALNDIDVVYFDPTDVSVEREDELADSLMAALRGERFAVKNQARMHLRNRERAYMDSTDAMRHWPETCTAIGVRLLDHLELTAPFGLADLFGLVLRPSSTSPETIALVRRRIALKRWLEIWPRLRPTHDVA